jgi:hypothetical protein
MKRLYSVLSSKPVFGEQSSRSMADKAWICSVEAPKQEEKFK